ncbi:RDD family protein [Rothia nasimurium]|uniref:RDD family protein n=1 Tax=Rothia nasimurium TaxID=85336 RepID=UPI001F414536|nr:RDD family protein [Rothia nasimurium]
MVSRKDLGSWIEGAPTWMEYPGQDMGRPRKGRGAIARPLPRLLAFAVDWYLVEGLFWLLGRFLFPEVNVAVIDVVQLVFFWLYMVVAVGFMGHTVGHFALGMQVQRLDGKPAGWLSALIRQSLVMLLLPVLIMDANQRGLHDQARHTVLVVIR